MIMWATEQYFLKITDNILWTIYCIVVVKQQINDKMKHRLQQLDEFEENVSEHKGLSRDDYVTRITQISHELHHAWALDQRVKALKIVIQVKGN